MHAPTGVSLVLGTGTFTAVMGPSGSGKSTLLNCAAGLERPTGGTVAVGGEPLTDRREGAVTRIRRARIGQVFQGFHLLPYLNADQNVALPLRLAGRRPDTGRVGAALDSVGLSGYGDRLPTWLLRRAAATRRHRPGDGHRPSGRARRRAHRPADTRSAREVLGLLRGAVDRDGRTVMMVTHDPVAASYADQVVFLVDGAVVGRMTHPTVDAVATEMANLDGSTLVANGATR